MSLISKIGLRSPILLICIITMYLKWNMLEFQKDLPIWMTRDGVDCTANDAYGCKVTHAIIRPEMCLCGDEVGGNICMAGDGHVGGELFLAERGTIP